MTDKDIRQTDCTFNRRLHRHATRMWSEALWTMYPIRRSREADGISESNTRYGTSLGCMVNRSELSINLVKTNKPKLLKGLGQKASGIDVSLVSRYTRLIKTTGEQTEPKHSMSSLWNVETPTVRPKYRARQPQGNPMDEGSRRVQKAKASR
jgi:hypothetical protein